MVSRAILAGLLLLAAMPVCAEPARSPQPGAFEQRVVAILDAGGSVDTIQSRLSRVGADRSLTHDQRVAIDAVRALVRSKNRPKGMSLAEAEAFAARNSGSPASGMVLAEALLANDEPQRSADTLLAAVARWGPMVQLISPVTISRLSAELDELGDTERAANLGKALTNAGWSRGSASLRSYLAMAAIRRDLAAGRFEEARRLLRSVQSPAALYEILIDNRLAALRVDVERIAGPRLETAWREYLTGTRDEWLARGDLISATAYADALKQANRYDVLADAFGMRFTRGSNCPTDLVARALADDLADSLARAGRWTKAEDVMRRSGGVSTPVYAAMLLERGEFGRAASLLDRAFRAADPPEDQDGEAAVAWLRAARSCAGHRDGGAAAAFDPNLLDLSARIFVLLCLDRREDAKAALLNGLDDEAERADALRWVQPFLDPPVQSEFRRMINAKVRALQRDPAVVAGASRHGVILDWALVSSVPLPEQLASTRPEAPWRCGDRFDWEMAAPQADPRTQPVLEPRGN